MDDDLVADHVAPQRFFSAVDYNKVLHLRLVFLLPLSLVVLAIVVTLTIFLYQYEHREINANVMSTSATALDFYNESVRQDTDALHSVLDVLLRNKELSQALAEQDRQALLQESTAIFNDLRRNHQITHFYYHSVERVNILRVHAPNHYDDLINRTTMRRAYESRARASGLELGEMGIFTLRVVSPWYDSQQRLIGFVELGMEIDQVLKRMSRFFGVEVFALIHKDFLNRERWEEGMRVFGHHPDWDRFPDSVVSFYSSQHQLTELLDGILVYEGVLDRDQVYELTIGGFHYRLSRIAMMDAANLEVAHMVLLANVSHDFRLAREAAFIGGAISLSLGLSLLALFFWLTGRIGRQMDNDEKALTHLASHDGLTGLLNHRVCYAILDQEGDRCRRYGSALSLLMIDIDHFKAVNDKYGHLIGDAVLKEVAGLLSRHVRGVDRVCRYGGEEVAVILPETTLDEAQRFAERLRRTVASYHFHVGESAVLALTVSVGVAATPPLLAGDSTLLVEAADRALYNAKEGGRNRVCIDPSAASL